MITWKDIHRVLRKVLSAPFIWLILFYRRCISPLKPPTCRFTPTCSEYFILAVRKYGPLRGALKGVWRILRCNPFSAGGTDWP